VEDTWKKKGKRGTFLEGGKGKEMDLPRWRKEKREKGDGREKKRKKQALPPCLQGRKKGRKIFLLREETSKKRKKKGGGGKREKVRGKGKEKRRLFSSKAGGKRGGRFRPF